MNDLISREKALEALEEANTVVKGLRFGKTILAEYARQVREGYIDVVKNVPSEDAEFNKYGAWQTVGKSPSGSIIRKCTYCGKERTGRGKSAYCPDCGAKMRKNDDIIFGQDSFDI